LCAQRSQNDKINESAALLFKLQLQKAILKTGWASAKKWSPLLLDDAAFQAGINVAGQTN
jgi:hypothetical protein